MDVVEFIRIANRMCADYDEFIAKAKEAASIIEQCGNEHTESPIKTHQSEFLKKFPNADLKTIARMLPCSLDKTLKPLRCAKYGYLSITCRCDRCRDDYWLTEVTDND